MSTRDRVYVILFSYVYLDYYDILKVGSGHQTNNSLIEVRGRYTGNPRDLYIPAGNMFVEFDADSSSQYHGFNIQIIVEDSAGKKLFLFQF